MVFIEIVWQMPDGKWLLFFVRKSFDMSLSVFYVAVKSGRKVYHVYGQVDNKMANLRATMVGNW